MGRGKKEAIVKADDSQNLISFSSIVCTSLVKVSERSDKVAN